ncbi:hypothetical protein [Arthrobacter sp. Br18]|uniref:hypothetical protein n=1 Tax=Arthrobacter sp. Br18 TaxID=1312954 RepID=UPI00047DDBF5
MPIHADDFRTAPHGISFRASAIPGSEDRQKRSDVLVRSCRMTEGSVRYDDVVRAASLPDALQIPGLFKILQDVQGCPRRDADRVCDVVDENVRVGCHRQEDMAVVGQEGPRMPHPRVGRITLQSCLVGPRS